MILQKPSLLFFFYFLFFMSYGSVGMSMNLDQYLQRVKSQNKIFKSLNYSVEASNEKVLAGDIALAPVMTAAGSNSIDQSLPSTIGNRREITEYSLGVLKKFSTGTALTLSAKTDQFKNDTVIPGLDMYSTGGLGISLQQSLWKDFLGGATDLRRQREIALNQAEALGYSLQLRQSLYDAEATFWDYTFAKEDLDLKKENFDRARKLEKWTFNRVSNGISDRADLMNVKALAATREVQLTTAEDEYKTQETKFREFLVLEPTEVTPNVEADLKAARNNFADLNGKKNVARIDYYLTSLQAKTRRFLAEEIQDSLRPDLSLVGSYNTSAYDRDYAVVSKNLAQTDRPKTFIGVNFSWIFDTDAKKAQLSSSSKDALAAQYLAERNLILGRNAWSDLQRKYEISLKNIKTLEKVASYQRERAKAEQDKFSKGRSITSSVVIAETDAAEAEVTLLKAKSGLRKLEASGLLFIAL